MQSPEEEKSGQKKDIKKNIKKPNENKHIGSSNAFEETENPLSRDADDISDEKLDELLVK